MNSHWAALLVFMLALARVADGAEPVATEAGPQNGGMRLRWTVKPYTEEKKSGYAVRLELLNVSQEVKHLKADWLYDRDDGVLKDYLEAATSIESQPPFASWAGQIMGGQRSKPQPTLDLKPGETLELSWQTDGNFLKNRVSNRLEVQNPEFTQPGIYSVHANLLVLANDEKVPLRSNEQLVSFGKSWQMPKHTYGELTSVDMASKTAWLNLGSWQQVKKGDVFLVRTAMVDFWRLKIVEVKEKTSMGKLEPMAIRDAELRGHELKPPSANVAATLMIPDAIDRLFRKLGSSFGLWKNGMAPMLEATKDTPVEDVVKEVFEKISFDDGKVTEFKILQKRYDHMDDSPEMYWAVRVHTSKGEKIVLLQEPSGAIGWWSRVYPAE